MQQDHFKYDEYPVLDTVMMGNARLYEIMKEKKPSMQKKISPMKTVSVPANWKLNSQSMNGWEAESDAATLLNGLGIEQNCITK